MSLLNHSRKFFLHILLCLNVVFIVNGVIPEIVKAEQKEQAKIEGAKKEGLLVFYSVINTHDSYKLLEGFKKKYPFIRTELYRAPAGKLLNKILLESRAKSDAADVFLLNLRLNLIVEKEGLLQKYVSPESQTYPEAFRDPKGYWTSSFVVTRVLGYNTNLVSPRDVPKRYEDLLLPKYKGKIGLQSEEADWFASTLQIMGREKGLEFMKKLADQDLSFHLGRTLLAQLLAAGEFSIEPQLNGHEVEVLKAQGAPIDWVALDPVLNFPMPITVAAQAPHPQAARLFVDFVLSKEGQEIMRSVNRIPCRPDVPPNPPRLIQGMKLLPYNPAWAEDAEENMRLFRGIFLQRGKR